VTEFIAHQLSPLAYASAAAENRPIAVTLRCMDSPYQHCASSQPSSYIRPSQRYGVSFVWRKTTPLEGLGVIMGNASHTGKSWSSPNFTDTKAGWINGIKIILPFFLQSCGRIT